MTNLPQEMLMTQVLADAYGCDPSIEDVAALTTAAKAGADVVGAKIVGETVVQYVPHGLTVALFLAESHIVLTTWPEHRLMLIDTLLCNPHMDADKTIDKIASLLCPTGSVVRHRALRSICSTPPNMAITPRIP